MSPLAIPSPGRAGSILLDAVRDDESLNASSAEEAQDESIENFFGPLAMANPSFRRDFIVGARIDSAAGEHILSKGRGDNATEDANENEEASSTSLSARNHAEAGEATQGDGGEHGEPLLRCDHLFRHERFTSQRSLASPASPRTGKRYEKMERRIRELQLERDEAVSSARKAADRAGKRLIFHDQVAKAPKRFFL